MACWDSSAVIIRFYAWLYESMPCDCASAHSSCKTTGSAGNCTGRCLMLGCCSPVGCLLLQGGKTLREGVPFKLQHREALLCSGSTAGARIQGTLHGRKRSSALADVGLQLSLPRDKSAQANSVMTQGRAAAGQKCHSNRGAATSACVCVQALASADALRVPTGALR